MKKITDLSIKEIAEKIRLRELSCVEVVQNFLDVIEKNNHLNAIIYNNRDKALEEATELDKEANNGSFRSLLHGVPFIVKDNIHVAGIPNTAGTPSLQNYIPKDDASSIIRLKNAGCILLAKANMHELAYGITSDNPTFERVKNPYNIDYTPGGSSGGTGAAIASHMAPIGLGTDTSCSVRVPASVNGICGLRPTLTRYPNDAVTPISYIRDTIGPMAHSVEDLIVLDEILTGQKYETKFSCFKGIRLGISNDYLCADLDPQVKDIFDKTKQILANEGVEFIDINFESVRKYHDECGSIICYYGSRFDLEDYIQKYSIPVTFFELVKKIASKDVKLIFEKFVMSNELNIEKYNNALNVRKLLIKAYHDLFNQHDILAIFSPTLPCMPIRFDELSELNEIENWNVIEKFFRNCSPTSVSGMTSLSIPIESSSNGLPIGLLLDGLENSDHLILNLGQLIQEKLINHKSL